MNEVLALLAIVPLSAGILFLMHMGAEPWLRKWVWVAFLEYGAAAIIQYFTGVDANAYRGNGLELMRFLDDHFWWAAWQNCLLLAQQPSAFDGAILGAGTNTGSMSAAAAFVVFVLRGSAFGTQAFMAACALFGSLAIFRTMRRAAPEASPQRLFFAIVLFPSVAFWTSALHKESFCLMGLGLIFAAWKAIYDKKIRAIPYAIVGLFLIIVMRAPALPPILGGIVLYEVLRRIQRAKSAEAVVVAPMYLLLGAAVIAGAMVLVTTFAPDLAIGKLNESVATHQRGWKAAEGGSNFDVENEIDESTGAQLGAAPLALINALFRPQLFDVRNASMLVSALEMTFLTFLIIAAIRINGPGGVVRRITRSPFLVMCIAITVVGCTFVGLTTRNFGSLSRYRVPFLPFYGAFLGLLTQRVTAAVAAATNPNPSPKKPAAPKKLVRGRRALPT